MDAMIDKSSDILNNQYKLAISIEKMTKLMDTISVFRRSQDSITVALNKESDIVKYHEKLFDDISAKINKFMEVKTRPESLEVTTSQFFKELAKITEKSYILGIETTSIYEMLQDRKGDDLDIKISLTTRLAAKLESIKVLPDIILPFDGDYNECREFIKDVLYRSYNSDSGKKPLELQRMVLAFVKYVYGSYEMYYKMYCEGHSNSFIFDRIRVNVIEDANFAVTIQEKHHFGLKIQAQRVIKSLRDKLNEHGKLTKDAIDMFDYIQTYMKSFLESTPSIAE